MDKIRIKIVLLLRLLSEISKISNFKIPFGTVFRQRHPTDFLTILFPIGEVTDIFRFSSRLHFQTRCISFPFRWSDFNLYNSTKTLDKSRFVSSINLALECTSSSFAIRISSIPCASLQHRILHFQTSRLYL
jgi:hypothetical protein